PGEQGNVVFAAHRDTFFRPLREIRKEDRITVTTTQGTHHYTVDSSEVVDPDATEVLQASSQPLLTLITCYPFYYVGHAPKRFVVRARELIEEPAPKPEPSVISQAAPPPEPPISKPSRRGSRRTRSERALARAAASPVEAVGPKKPPAAPPPLQANAIEPKPPAEPAAEQHKTEAPPQPEKTGETSLTQVAAQNAGPIARKIRRLNPVRLFGRLGRLVRRPDQPNPDQPEEALP
ncbi:MAG TPA: class D sortase, partial [Polyangiaceae bacterium]